MSKLTVSLVVAAVMMVGSSASADIGNITSGVLHFQDFSSTLLNGVSLMHGSQEASSSNFATIQNQQHAVGSCGTFARENQTAFFNQVGDAYGNCTLADLDQSILALGTQQQTIGDGTAPKFEAQALTLSGEQLVSKTDGQGTVNGNQIMTLSQEQGAQGASGPMDQSSVVFGTQNTVISGAPGATGAAGSSLFVTTSQEQLVQ